MSILGYIGDFFEEIKNEIECAVVTADAKITAKRYHADEPMTVEEQKKFVEFLEKLNAEHSDE